MPQIGRSADERLGRQRGLGDAEQHRLGYGGLAAPCDDLGVLLLEQVLLDLLVHQEIGVTDLLDANAAEHLANDGLDVLVVDADALESVDLLDLVHQPGSELLLALHPEDVVGICRTVLQRVTGADMVTGLDLHVLALGNQVLP